MRRRASAPAREGAKQPGSAGAGLGLPVATGRVVTSSAGECGVKDQVSRSGQVSSSQRIGLAIVGATATGKTALSVALARSLQDVELVSVDAMAVYRGMDVGTAKPSAPDRAAARWHLIDVVEPCEEFTVARFQRAARAALAAAESRSHRAVLVGGTGLYHRAVLDDLALPGRYPSVAARLWAEAATPGGSALLYAQLAGLDPPAAARIEPSNTRRLVRALEVTLGSGRPFSSSGPGLGRYGATRFVLVGLALARPQLDARICERFHAQVRAGFLEEVDRLLARERGMSRTARSAIGYRELGEHLRGRYSFEEACAATLQRTRRFARRQEAWFRRDPRVCWLDAESGVAEQVQLVRSLLERAEQGGGRMEACT